MLPTVRRVLLVAGGLVTLAFAEEPPTFGPFGAECQVAFAPDGQALAVTTRGGSAALVARDDGRRLRRFRGERDESESAVAFSPDGARLALATLEGVVRVFDVATGEPRATLAHGGPVRSLAFTADGARLLTGGGRPSRAEDPDEVDPDGPTARVWDATTGAPLLDLDAATGNAASAVATSPVAASVVAVARDDGTLSLRDLAAETARDVDLGGPSRAVAFSPDGALVAAAGGRGGAEVTLVSVSSGEVVRTLGRRAEPAAGGAVAFSPDGRTLARLAPGAEEVRLFDVATGAPRGVLAVRPAASLAPSPLGDVLAVGLRAGKVVLLPWAAEPERR